MLNLPPPLPASVLGPFLLGCSMESRLDGDPAQPEKPPARTPWEELPPHDDEGQVRLDVDRSFIYYPTSMPPPRVVVPPG